MSGAFQTSREIFGSPIWKNVVDFRMFFLIYGNAVFSEDGVRLADDLILNRGEWCRSTRKLQEDLQYIENRQIKTYSTSVINRCIKRLEALQMICTRTHQLGTVFTVVNYSKYQGLSNYYNANLERNLEHSGNSGGTLGEHSGNNNKNVKNVNKVKNEKNKDIKEYSSETYELTNHLIDLMQMNNPNVKIPNELNKWHDAIDKLQRLDKYEYMQVRSIIDWCQNDTFWKANILSATKLREKVGTLVLQMKRTNVEKIKPLSQFEKMMKIAEREGVASGE